MVSSFLFRAKRIAPALILLLLCASPLWAATTGKIAGRIADAESGEALPGANVTIIGTDMGAASDLDGNYFVINVPPGEYTVRATMMGYKVVNQTGVRVKIGQTAPLDFSLEQTVISGEEVTVIATRPVVELDLTASKQVMSGEQLAQSFVTTIEQATMVQSGVNVHGGVRGGFGLDVPYVVDGQLMRDTGSNASFSTLSTTAIQEMEVLTGGFNAEFGQANSGIINVVTKSSTDRINGAIKYRYRPSGVYHWGGNIYGEDRWEFRQFDWFGNPAPGNPDFWDPTKPGGKDGGGEPYSSMTPAERVEAWKNIITEDPTLTEYAERAEWEMDFTFTGPIPVVKNMGFMLTGRWKEGVLEYPSSMKYHPQWNLTGKLNYDITDNTKVVVSASHMGTRNGGKYVLPYSGGSEVAGFGSGNPVGYFTSAYEVGKYWPFGNYGFGGGTGLGRVKPPEEISMYTGYLKATHVFSPSTYLEFMYSHAQIDRRANFFRVDKAWYSDPNFNYPIIGSAMGNGFFVNWGEPGDRWWSTDINRDHTFKLDLVSQINPVHQIKAGAKFSTQYFFSEIVANSGGEGATDLTRFGWANDLVGPLPYAYPWEAAAYFQDKIEIKGMVINAGLRLDLFNGNKIIPPNVVDPLGLSTGTVTHPADVESQYITYDRDSRFSEETPTRVALSPRIGISHPITESTVLHFMYGHFNQRPSWYKILHNGSISYNDPGGVNSVTPTLYFDPDVMKLQYSTNGTNWNNPWLSYEKVIQYEIGFDQNILDKVRVDVTLFYKDGTGLTTLGTTTGGRQDASGYSTSGNPTVNLRGLPDQNKLGNGVSVPQNAGTLESRGLEVLAETRLVRNVDLFLTYNMAYAVSDDYGPATLYVPIPGVPQQGNDSWRGGNNGDGGTSGNSNERWNPNHTLKFNAVFTSPEEFGPALGSIYPLEHWTVNWFTQWNSGRLYTYHSPGDFSTETNNMRWDGKMFTNLRVARMIDLLGLRAELSVDVYNLFNQKQLRMFGGTEMVNYQEEGIKPYHSTTGEDLEWEWYELDLLPRKVYFGLGIEF